MKVQDSPERVVHMQKAMAHFLGLVNQEREQKKLALASANNAQEKVQHLESNITNFKTDLTEAAQGHQTMHKEVAGPEKREHEDMMACIGGIEEAKDIELQVTGETQRVQESHKTMHQCLMRVQEQVSDLQHQIAGLGSGERPNEPERAVGGDRLDLGPVVCDLTLL